MKICAIVVTYNGLKWIEACLNSLKNSSINIEIIVIDNASTDGTNQFIKKNFPRVRLIERIKNIGFGRGNNVGMNIALNENMDYIFLLNQDAFVHVDAIETLVKNAEKNKEYGIISPVHLNKTGDFLDDSFLYYLKNQGNNDFLSDLVLKNPKRDIYDFKMINAAAWLLSRKTLEMIGGFSPLFFMYGEDINYAQRVKFHGLKIGVVPTAFINHDSDNKYHPEFKPGSEKYFEKFLIRTKVAFADVNPTSNNLNNLKYSILKQMLKSMLMLDLNGLKINLRKFRIISGMNFSAEIQKDRLKGPTYLQ